MPKNPIAKALRSPHLKQRKIESAKINRDRIEAVAEMMAAYLRGEAQIESHELQIDTPYWSEFE